MEEYRKLREKYSLLGLCRNPELAAEVTLQPIRRFDLDAAIIFADILLPLPGMGIDFDFEAGEGPKIHRPIRSPADVTPLSVGEPERSLSYVLEALEIVRRELPKEIALIGATPPTPLLVNLWATWCQPCLTEISEWSKQQQRFTENHRDL